MSMLFKDQIKEMIRHYDIKTTKDTKDVFKDMFGEMGAVLKSYGPQNIANCRLLSQEIERVNLSLPLLRRIDLLFLDYKNESLPCMPKAYSKNTEIEDEFIVC
ncbi:hypothetical protein [Enterococcus gilvus]|uniref:hypothetical protein n=1 Tax=Enterococcus gilvus TaxID=160453 RepID=UPI003EDB072E